MTLRAEFADYKLTADQEQLLELLQAFLSGSNHCFLLKGYAGTGKTFMMQGVTRFLRKTEVPFRILAPTGRAAKVISQKTASTASTIHKAIYLMEDLKEYRTEDIDDTETYKYYFDLAANFDNAHTIYIVDEASMISNAYSEGEFFRFGSGHLLNDLLQYINLDNNDHCKKVIFIGDPAQLPPVNSRISPALDADYLSEFFGLAPTTFEMKQVVRQQEHSGILANASVIRDGISQQSYRTFNMDTAYDDLKAINAEELLPRYISACAKTADEECIIVALSNRQVKDYNDLVRQYRYPDQPTICPGDRVLVVHNNYRHEISLLNGDFGDVIEVDSEVESRTVFLNKPIDGKRVGYPVDLSFRNLVVRFRDIQNRPHDIHCMVNENLLNSTERGLSSDENKALYVDFKSRYPKVKPGTSEFKEIIKNDPYFNCLQLKYGYAVTCHKAQGGEWKNVFVDFSSNSGYYSENYFRWAYTAITRAQSNLDCLNAPHFGILTQVKGQLNSGYQSADNVICVPTEAFSSEFPFDIPAQTPFLANIVYTVIDLIKSSGINITGVDHKQYCEHYAFARGASQAVALIDYTAKDRISHIRWKPDYDSELHSDLLRLLQPLVGKSIIGERTPLETKISFPMDAEYLRDFYKAIQEKALSQGISITKVTHLTVYHVKYIFTKSNLSVEFDNYFNAKGQLTKVIPNLDHCMSNSLLKEVLELIQ